MQFPMPTFKLEDSGRFIITGYQRQRPFSSTLPGIAGPMGIPMWIFYVNRGQAITSFGVENKDHPIMEFQPANKAYQVTPFLGFRTFIKCLEVDGPVLYEPFAAGSQNEEHEMQVSLSELKLRQENPTRGLRVEVLYFTLPEEKAAGLVRQLKVTNLASQPARLEILDGLPVIIPYGTSNSDLKESGRTIEAWMEVYNLENKAPFFRLRSTPDDTAEIRPVRAGNFALALATQKEDNRRLPVFVNPETVFGYDTSLSFPAIFHQQSLSEMSQQPQHAHGKTPCAFFGCPAFLAPGESITLHSIYGYASRVEVLNEVSEHMNNDQYLLEKRRAANALISQLTIPIETRTSSPEFDAYCRQTFLDNVLRGGWPVHLGQDEKPVTYHIYSRKHGDPERDYNAFSLSAEHYSQGNGNYRDVNQNRRSEVWFDPQVGDANVHSFMSLIQADGYNPLVVKGSWFQIPPEQLPSLLALAEQPEQILPLLEKPFTPGGLLKWIDEKEINLHIAPVEFLLQALHKAEQDFDAEFSEGFWTDHWIYNLDLINNFLNIYPDRADALLFGQDNLTFFDSPVFVQPRSKKYVLTGNQPRQYEAVAYDEEKEAMIAARREHPHLVRSQNGRGDIYRTNLYTKLFLLVVIKFATLDPLGMGIEMEADKPAWCDALNGLPGLFGSSLSETFELARLLTFLLDHTPENRQGTVCLPVELDALIRDITACLGEYHASEFREKDFLYWDAAATAREAYREKTRFGFEGKNVNYTSQELAGFLNMLAAKVQAGIEQALELNKGVPPTYFTYEVENYEILRGPDGEPLRNTSQCPHIRALQFQQRVLPPFLEGPVHMFKTLADTQSARQLHQQVKNSDLFDRFLKMYKTNVSLKGQPMEIGRVRSFTPGWLENESIFLHMEYKYLLELLKAGLYDEFFEDFRSALVAFQDPARYGRSPLENSSFIVSSAHPDKSLHGAGFVARLTGATAEFINMWHVMMAGRQPFSLLNGELHLSLRPALPGWLFDSNNQIRFNFLGSIPVTYHNPQRADTWNLIPGEIILHLPDGQSEGFQSPDIHSPFAAIVRNREVKSIDVFFAE